MLLSAVPAQSTSYSDLYFSHIAEGFGYYTGIAFLNSNTRTTTINIDAVDRNGGRVASATVTLPARQRRSRIFSELFPGLTTQLGGYVHVSASRSIFAFQLFGSRSSLSFLANIAAQCVQLQPQASGRSVSAATGANVISADSSSSIAIPPGALSSDTTISLNSVTVALPAPSSTLQIIASVDAQPSGTTFNIPVRLTFPLDVQLEPGTQFPLLIYTPQGAYEDSGFTATVSGLTPITFTATAKTLAMTPEFIEVKIDSGSIRVGGYQLTINYDKDRLQLTNGGITAGPSTVFSNTVNTTEPGVVVIGGIDLNSVGQAGGYTVAKITFTPIRTGPVTLILSGVSVSDATSTTVSSSFLSLSTTSLTVN